MTCLVLCKYRVVPPAARYWRMIGRWENADCSEKDEFRNYIVEWVRMYFAQCSLVEVRLRSAAYPTPSNMQRLWTHSLNGKSRCAMLLHGERRWSGERVNLGFGL